MTKRVRRVGFALKLFVAAGLLITAAPATATNVGSAGSAGTGGTTNGVWYTDGNLFIVAKRNLTAVYSNGVTQAINEEYIPTDLVVQAQVSSFCSDSDHDLCVYDENYGDNGLNGWASCFGTTVGAHPNQVCTVAWVRINQFFSPPAKRIACHEMGHTVGLRHTQEQASCLKRTIDGGNSSQLSPHDDAHVNARY